METFPPEGPKIEKLALNCESWVKAQAARLKEEGHKIIWGKGKKAPKVQDFEKSLA